MRDELNRVPRRVLIYFAATALVGILLASASVSADVVSPPPDECPVGSLGDTCHGGPYCRLSECTDDSRCDDGMTCQEVDLCVGGHHCYGRIGDGTTMQTSEGLCGDEGECERGDCETVRVCAPEPEPEAEEEEESTTPATQGAGCAIASSGSAAGLCFGLALMAVVLLRLRRRRS